MAENRVRTTLARIAAFALAAGALLLSGCAEELPPRQEPLRPNKETVYYAGPLDSKGVEKKRRAQWILPDDPLDPPAKSPARHAGTAKGARAVD
jgi:hypothetical protein